MKLIEKQKQIENYENRRILYYIFIWFVLVLNWGVMRVYSTEYDLPQTGLLFAPYGYSPIIWGTIINVIGILSLGIVYIMKRSRTK